MFGTVGIARAQRFERLLFIRVGDEDAGRVDHDLIDGIEELLLLDISH